MKSAALCSLLAAAVGTGMGLGWLLWAGNPDETRTPSHISKALPSPLAERSAHTPASARDGIMDTATERSASLVTAELEKMKSLSVDAFAARMADAWLSDSANPDVHLRRALYLSVCDAGRGMAFWREHSRRKNLKLEENTVIENFFTVVGYNDGKRFAEKIIEAAPQVMINGVLAGWAASAPEAAVDWFNALPENSPQYQSAVHGLMWGLAEKSPATGKFVFEQLKPGDRDFHAAVNLSLSTTRNHGMQGLHDLVSGMRDDAQRQLVLTSAMSWTMNEQPSGDFVQWMAGPLESAPYLRGNFEQMANRWATSVPDAAMTWLQQNALQSGHDTALSIVAASLARSGRGGDIAAWLAANPDTPGRAAIASGKSAAAGN